MNLYSIDFIHFSPKDSETGIKGLLISESDEEVYNYISKKYADWDYNEEDDDEFRERTIEVRGEMNDEYYEPTDLYYGAIAYGWTLIKEDITDDLLRELVSINLAAYPLNPSEL